MDVMKAVESLQSDLWGVWFLIGAALVFWDAGRFCYGRGWFYQSQKCR